MYTMDFAQVGANIQRELDRNSLTQQSLADALSISKQVMNKIIKGTKAINVSELAQIASVLGISTDTLLTINTYAESSGNLTFMGKISDEQTREKVELLRLAIDEIQFLEELIYV